MRQVYSLHVPGGNTYPFYRNGLESLQARLAETEAVAYPLFLRVGNRPTVRLQPIAARALLAEVEHFQSALASRSIAGVLFRDAAGVPLGSIYSGPDEHELVSGLAATSEGIRLEVTQFPPPVGFRSRPGLPAGRYECYFEQIRMAPGGPLGARTAAMGGSGAPVQLPPFALPPVTRWDVAIVSGKPVVATLEAVTTPATEVYRDIIHAFVSACTESLLMKAPLEIRRD